MLIFFAKSSEIRLSDKKSPKLRANISSIGSEPTKNSDCPKSDTPVCFFSSLSINFPSLYMPSVYVYGINFQNFNPDLKISY